VTVQEAIAQAEKILPGHAAPDYEIDPRWQAIIEIGEFVKSDPEEIWHFISRWGIHSDDDLRTAVATCLLEHLLEYHFDAYFAKTKALVRKNSFFADTFSRCFKFGQSEESHNSQMFDKLKRECRLNKVK
jgi:hypothetical protein